jgi:hypothetical protein
MAEPTVARLDSRLQPLKPEAIERPAVFKNRGAQWSNERSCAIEIMEVARAESLIEGDDRSESLIPDSFGPPVGFLIRGKRERIRTGSPQRSSPIDQQAHFRIGAPGEEKGFFD